MSLFGDEDVPSSRAKQLSGGLFDDDDARPVARTGNSLFADEMDNDSSPWTFPTPKKGGRASLVKSLLPVSEVPESYIDTFDALVEAGDGAGNGISIEGAKKLLASSGIPSDAQSKILEIVAQPGQESATRNEFNVLFALIGLAQEGDDITLDSVDERKSGQWDTYPTAISMSNINANRTSRANGVTPELDQTRARSSSIASRGPTATIRAATSNA